MTAKRGPGFLIGKVIVDAGSSAIGSVTVSNFPATQPVSGTVTVGSSALPTNAATETTQGFVRTAVEALAALISGGKLLTSTVLTAGSAAIGKLAANSGVVIGAVEIAASQTIALAAGAAAIGKLSANTAATYIGDVVLQASTAAIGKLAANTAATYIGDVVVPLAASSFQDTDTNVTAGTRRTLASHGSLVFGFYITNTHASATVYVGTAAGVSSTAFVFRLAPGQSTPLIPLNNSNLIGWDTNTSGATISYGGF